MLTYIRLVIDTLEPLPGDRKCFRMINGVLTERTVEEVVPILKTNSDGLKKALEELVKQYKSKQEEMEKWKVCLSFPPVLSLRTWHAFLYHSSSFKHGASTLRGSWFDLVDYILLTTSRNRRRTTCKWSNSRSSGGL